MLIKIYHHVTIYIYINTSCVCSVLIYCVRVLWIFTYICVYIYTYNCNTILSKWWLACHGPMPQKTRCVSILKNQWDTQMLPHSTCRFCPTLRSTESKTTGALETRHARARWGATCMYCKVIRSKWMESCLLPLENTIKRMFMFCTHFLSKHVITQPFFTFLPAGEPTPLVTEPRCDSRCHKDCPSEFYLAPPCDHMPFYLSTAEEKLANPRRSTATSLGCHMSCCMFWWSSSKRSSTHNSM